MHGDENLRVVGTALELLAQLEDMSVDGSICRELIIAPHMVQDLGSGKSDARAAEKKFQ